MLFVVVLVRRRCSLLFAVCSLSVGVVNCLLFVVVVIVPCWLLLFVVNVRFCGLCIGCCSLFGVACLLCVVSCFLFLVRCVLFADCWLFFVVLVLCCLLLCVVVRSLLFVCCCS